MRDHTPPGAGPRLGPLHPPSREHTGRTRSRWAAYLALTKPRIIGQLLITTVPAMILAADGWPGTVLVAVTMLGGALAAGSANAFNMVIDRDIDRVMERTRSRPLVTGEIGPRGALAFASLIGTVSLVLMAALVNLLAASLTAIAIALYVGLYTMVLKRRTDQNIIWGGAAGCMPVLIGWAAVTGSLALAPALLFLVVFLWTPAHYWPLALAYRDDYADAHVPMLPVTTSAPVVARRVIGYAAALVVLALALAPAAGLGAAYLVPTALAGAAFLAAALRLLRVAVRRERDVTAVAMATFRCSLIFLTVVFLAVAIDPLL